MLVARVLLCFVWSGSLLLLGGVGDQLSSILLWCVRRRVEVAAATPLARATCCAPCCAAASAAPWLRSQRPRPAHGATPHLHPTPCLAQSAVPDLLYPSQADEARKHKLKRLVQSPNSYFMDVRCPGCLTITPVFSHAQTTVICSSCSVVLCQPTGGIARLTEGCSFRKK